MRIVNAAVLDDLRAGRGLRLNLGSGPRNRDGFYNLDVAALDNVDIVADLNRPLEALPDDCAVEVVSRHTLEHIENLLLLLAELHRIVRRDGRIAITVPHFSNPDAWSDPTHVRQFGLFSMYYFCDPEDQPGRQVPTHYVPTRFFVDRVRINFFRRGVIDAVLGRLVRAAVNLSFTTQHAYERRFCWLWPAEEITYVMRPKK